jgi:hypothetical protein
MKAKNMLRTAKRLTLDELKERNDLAYTEMELKKKSYEDAKANGKLWSKKKKADSKAAKKLDRKEKRMAKA